MPIEEKSWQKYDIIPSNVEILRYFIGSLTFFCLFLYLHLLHSSVISVRANAENGLRYTFLGTEKHPCEMGSADHPFPNNQPASQASTLLFCLTGNLHKGENEAGGAEGNFLRNRRNRPFQKQMHVKIMGYPFRKTPSPHDKTWKNSK